ncbi:hypothetical protein [Plantactinospora sonchi]|uniref:Uncharacterized protein n=1 Tax=Plantactinospora sonchi TaxID=1544735 RepID=A0ABU7RRI7_9ACTN
MLKLAHGHLSASASASKMPNGMTSAPACSSPFGGVGSTSAVLDAADGNLLIARDAGGWASAATVNEVYGHVDIHDPAFDAALRTVWGETK